MACTAVHMYIDKLSVRLYSIVVDLLYQAVNHRSAFVSLSPAHCGAD